MMHPDDLKYALQIAADDWGVVRKVLHELPDPDREALERFVQRCEEARQVKAMIGRRLF